MGRFPAREKGNTPPRKESRSPLGKNPRAYLCGGRGGGGWCLHRKILGPRFLVEKKKKGRQSEALVQRSTGSIEKKGDGGSPIRAGNDQKKEKQVPFDAENSSLEKKAKDRFRVKAPPSPPERVYLGRRSEEKGKKERCLGSSVGKKTIVEDPVPSRTCSRSKKKGARGVPSRRGADRRPRCDTADQKVYTTGERGVIHSEKRARHYRIPDLFPGRKSGP